MRLLNGIALSVLGLIGTVTLAQAQPYPNRPITVVVPYPPGGATDPIARIFTVKLAEAWKVPIIIENRAGGGTTIGMSYGARAAPDGYTITVGTTSVGTNPALYNKLPYDTLKDFTFISQMGILQIVLSVHPSLPVKTLDELIAYAKKNPGKLNYSSFGNGTMGHLSGEYFKVSAGIDVTHVPYKGSAASTMALVSGEVSYAIDTLFIQSQHIKAGSIKPLVSFGPKRLESMPNMPTMVETYPGFTAFSWLGFMGPAGLPPEIVSKWSTEVSKIANTPEVKERLAQLGIDAVGGTSQQFADFAQAEITKWTKVVGDAKIPKEN
jgi:tripartite-type tricarboxylate transporter receptor subunit TctC